MSIDTEECRLTTRCRRELQRGGNPIQGRRSSTRAGVVLDVASQDQMIYSQERDHRLSPGFWY